MDLEQAYGDRFASGTEGQPGERRAVIQRILAKDISAFEELYRIYCPRLTRFLSKLVQRPQIVEEVMNDTVAHTVTARDHSFDLHLNPGQSAKLTLKKGGAIQIYCLFDSSMRGTLTASPR